MWDDAGIAVYQEAHFEKTLLSTDRTDWSPAPTVAAYRGQGSLENGFRQMKAPALCHRFPDVSLDGLEDPRP